MHKAALLSLFVFGSISLARAESRDPLTAAPLDGPASPGISTQGWPALAVPTRSVSDWQAALLAGADYLRRMQADVDTTDSQPDNADNGWDFAGEESPDDPDDAGWDWVRNATTDPFAHSGSPSPANVYGPVALGVLDAYLYTGSSDPQLLRLLQDVADYYLTSGTSYAAEITFLVRFQDLVGGTTYVDAARTKWDDKITTYGTAQDYAEYIRDVRAGQGYENGIIAWDIAQYVIAAQNLHDAFPGQGYDGDADQMAQVVFRDVYLDNPGYFDLEDDKFDFFYNLGVSGVLDCFNVSQTHVGEVDDLAALLLESQFPFGGFGYYYQDTWDWQTTAYAVLALSRLGNDYRQQIALANDALAATQDASGAWIYSDGSHYPEVAGEAVAALTRNAPSSSDIRMYTGANAEVVVHADGGWFDFRGSRFSPTNDWALFGTPGDKNQFSINVPEYGAVWNAPWESGTVHNFSDWEKYGLQLRFGPDVAGNEASVWRRPDADPEAQVVGSADWVLSYYETPRDASGNELDSSADFWSGGTIVHSILYGAVENLSVEVTGGLGLPGSTIRFTGTLTNSADESPDEVFEYFGFGDHPDEASVDGDYIGQSTVAGYDFDFTVVWDRNESGTYVYGFPDEGGITLSSREATPDTLSLNVTSGLCINSNADPTVTVELRQALLDQPVRGYQAWTLFDDALLSFTGGSYTPSPYGLPVLTPIAASGSAIDLAAGIDDFGGQAPTMAGGTLATLTFDATGTVTGDTFSFTFDTTRDPPSRFTGETGQEVVPFLQDSLTVTVDNDAPVLTCSDITVDNDPGTCEAVVDVGTPAATDVGCGVATITGIRDDGLALADPYPVGTTTVTWTATDFAGNTATCAQQVVVNDVEVPELVCGGDLQQHADAGACAAVVSWVAATADDVCDGDLSANVLYDIDLDDDGSVDAADVAATEFTFPAGPTPHRVTAKVQDAAGNEGTCSFTVEVFETSEMVVDVELGGSLVAGPFTRCVTFEFWTCPDTMPAATVEQTLTFNAGVANATVLVPCGDYSCVTARDRLHTLRATINRPGDGFGIVGTQYAADFTNVSGHVLFSGNLNDDRFIDILDFGVYSFQFSVNPNPGADTDCSTTGPHADINGDGVVDTGDFTFIQTGFLASAEPPCCPAPLQGPVADGPRTQISIEELHKRGLAELAAADLNADGWLDAADIVAFLDGARPKPPTPGPVGGLESRPVPARQKR